MARLVSVFPPSLNSIFKYTNIFLFTTLYFIFYYSFKYLPCLLVYVISNSRSLLI